MPDWLSSLFVHPEFVIPGAMLLSAPIIIHFINRMRFRRVDGGLKGLHCSHGALDLAAGAEAARKMLADLGGAARNFHLISDFRQSNWEEDTALALALGEMDRDKVTVNLIKTVAESHPNLGIVDLSGTVDVAAVNVPLRLSVTVHNYGEEVARDVRLTVMVDGQKRPVTETIGHIDGGKERTIEFDEQFSTIGPHEVQVSLPADALEQDNTRFLSIDVPDANPVLIISGSDDTESFYLYDALGADTKKTGFAPTLDRV